MSEPGPSDETSAPQGNTQSVEDIGEGTHPATHQADVRMGPLTHIGKYEVLRKLGEGATADVFLCNDPFNTREVAVKVVFADRLTDTEGGKLSKKLFITEASLAGKLQHPHIVQIFDATVGEDMSYIVMEYVDGGTLERFCNPDALLPIDKTVEIIFKCTRALDFANRLGVTHRDIKPANILLTGDTDIKISDFGAALMASAEETQVAGIGSPAYMSPQQIKEHPLNHQTDIYSLGVVMYQLLTGQLPFQASNNFSMMYQITNVEPALPSGTDAAVGAPPLQVRPATSLSLTSSGGGTAPANPSIGQPPRPAVVRDSDDPDVQPALPHETIEDGPSPK